MGQIFDRSNRTRLTQKNAEELFLQSTSAISHKSLSLLLSGCMLDLANQPGLPRAPHRASQQNV
jgi:hypothetical protein